MTCRRFLPFSPASYLALVVLVGLSACSGTSTEQTLGTVFQRPAETPSDLLGRLLEDDWRLFSAAFGSGARDGHEVGFMFDGYVEHGERRLGDVWTLEGTRMEECTLKVFPSSPRTSEVSMEFAYDDELDAFVFAAGLAHLVLAPRGFDFAGYLEGP